MGSGSRQARSRFARTLAGLYFVRTTVSPTWVLTVSALAGSIGSSASPGVLIQTLLVVYPLTDAAATVFDIRRTPPQSQTHFQRVNLATSILAAAAILAVLHDSFAAVLDVFGIWALISGAIQLIVAVRRHTLVSAQWFMAISGAGSFFAGTTFLRWSGSPHDGLSVLIQYAAGGAVWYLVAACLLGASAYKESRTA